MADEPGAGASYLASLRRSTPQAAGAAAGSTSLPALPRRDKRRSPRYRCEGSIHLRETRTGVATWATFTDINLSGCYVEIPTGYRVGTVLELEIELNGVRIAAAGEVRIAYPGLGMGIAFTKLPDPDRAQLRELVKSLSQSRINFPQAASGAPSQPQLPAMLPGEDPNPAGTLQAIAKFFESHPVMGREEFFMIVNKVRAEKTL